MRSREMSWSFCGSHVHVIYTLGTPFRPYAMLLHIARAAAVDLADVPSGPGCNTGRAGILQLERVARWRAGGCDKACRAGH